MDFLYVNILNEGSLPYLREKGPIFGYRMARGVYDILRRDPRLKIEVTTFADAEIKKKAYMDSKKPKLTDTFNVKEDINATVISVETETTKAEVVEPKSVDIVDNAEAAVDNEIDKILNESPKFESSIVVNLKDDLDVVSDNEKESEEDIVISGDKVYSNIELKTLTKAQLRLILRERGYNTGVYAPKYQDNLEQLRAKVKKTQEL